MNAGRLLRLAAAGLLASGLAAPFARGEDVKAPWQPKAPDGLPTDFDWIRLPSDEWLKGKIVSMYDGKLEFDSDELGVHTFDFADIKEIRTSRVVQVGFAGREPAMGRLVLEGATARVVGRGRRDDLRPDGDPDDRRRQRPRDRLLVRLRQRGRQHPQRQQRPGRLHGAARDDAPVGQGPHRLRLHRHHHPHRLRGHVQQPPGHPRLGPLPDASGSSSTWWASSGTATRSRTSPTAGRSPRASATRSSTTRARRGARPLGPAWQKTEWESVPPDGEESADSFALRVGTRFDHEFTKSIDFHAYYNAFFTDEASGTYTHHFDTGLEIELVGDLDFNVAWVWDRVQDPRPLEDGSFPKQDDTRLVFGLGWSF